MPTLSFFALALILTVAVALPWTQAEDSGSRVMLTLLAACALPGLSCWWGAQLAQVSKGQRTLGIRHGERVLWSFWLVLCCCIVALLQWPGVVRGALAGTAFDVCIDPLVVAPLVLPLWLGRWVFAAMVSGRVRKRRSLSLSGLPLRASMTSRFEMVALVLPAMLALVGWRWVRADGQSWIAWALGGTAMIVVLACYPRLLRWAWRLQSLPDGALRTDLSSLANRANARRPAIWVWPAGCDIATAAVVAGWPRPMVVLGDRLITAQTPRIVRAVFAHELAHLRRHHLFWRVLSVVAVWPWVVALVNQGFVSSAVVIIIGAALTAWLLSHTARLLEHDADLGACETLREFGDLNVVNTFELALRAMASPREVRRGGWLHPSVAARVKFLRDNFDDHGAARGFRLYRRGWLAAMVLLALPGWFAAFCL